MTKIRIEVGSNSIDGILYDTPTAKAIEQALPLEGAASIWGEEIYFEIPVVMERASGATAEVQIGQLGYWPAGRAFCIFFGPTPASHGNEPRAASPVNVFGEISGDLELLKRVVDGGRVQVTAA